jgi:GTP-binding protein EngB required for normal cell division
MNYNNAQFEKAFGRFEQLEESTLPEFCFCGRSNVGKIILEKRN